MSAHRNRYVLALLLLTAPILMAPTCVQKSVYPMPCGNIAGIGCATPESKLVETQSNAVLALGMSDWSNLEVCNLCPFNICLPRAGYEIHNNCSGTAPCECTYNMAPLTTYLDTYVPANSQHAVRNYMIQLAPIFTGLRRTPMYLNSAAWNSTAMKSAYHKLLDKVLAVVAARMVSTGANNTPVSPLVAIEFGNEVNHYLNAQTNPQTAWTQYIDFVKDAKAYVDSKVAYTFETVSTTWVGACGVGDWLRNPTASNPCQATATRAYELARATDLMTYTYYPQWLFTSTTPTPQLLSAAVAQDFAWIAWFAGYEQRPALLQEVGWPSPFPGTATQNDFVNAVFTEWAKRYDQIWGVGYFSLHDFTILGAGTFTWGLYNQNGTVKNQATWNNFAAKMRAVPLQ